MIGNSELSTIETHFTEKCFAIFTGEQRRTMKNNRKGQKNLIMPLLFLYCFKVT